ncbi:hypothetical protein PN471_00295 [Aphanizomenon sp. CS-733/32]|uniref:hypothetical protein n=1 Tax=Aphanizomenon sp. CS-733/32 TaxID=3021715 RepID=UPI00232F8051|nr:hypothetical protein [Aphanizomenon sp. CS-733/32]MDB9307127.1 hypothetical protein [Aphanizomenon sp. CS-733/32]
MGLFDQILGAVSNSTQPGGLDNLVNIATTVKQLGNGVGADSSTMESVLSVVGKQIQSSLQAKQATEGSQAVQELVNQFAGTSANFEAVSSLFSPDSQAQLAEEATQGTNLDVNKIQQLLPTLIPLVFSFLQSGGSPLLNKFLDADGDGDVDIADAIKLASKFLRI